MKITKIINIMGTKFHIGWAFAFLSICLALCIFALTRLV